MSNKNEKIFIQIASYRDPELPITIKNCIENADNPDKLIFGICWQHDDKECLSEYFNDIRFKIISVHYSQTNGCCWARNKIQQLYDNEEYTLQLDSHHRFVKGWDSILKNMYKKLQEKGFRKPIITTYLPSYNPENDPEDRCNVPWKISLDRITEEGQVLFIPSYIDNHSTINDPIPGKFYSAHFCFTQGLFCKEVPHDPELYFTGEEMSITVRAFTHGYNLFHPHILVAWHEYTRKNRVKQWDDDKEWWKKDEHSKKHYTNIFNNIKNGLYGFGKERTIDDYITFSGVNFINIKQEDANKHSQTNNADQVDKTNNDNDEAIDMDEANIMNQINYNTLDREWKNWIKQNIEIGITKEVIHDILIKANFKESDINDELSLYLNI